MGWFHSLIDWLDPDWFQAIASVAAIAAGFIYVGLEQHWSRRREEHLQAAMRVHAVLLCEDIVRWQTDVLKIFRLSNETGAATAQYSPPKPMTAFAMELMTMPVSDLGDPALASTARHIGSNAIGFIDEAEQSAGTVCEAGVLRRMTNMAEKTSFLVEHLKAKSGA